MPARTSHQGAKRDLRPVLPGGAKTTANAGHGFHCDRRADYDEAAAKLAQRRTLDFFGTHLG